MDLRRWTSSILGTCYYLGLLDLISSAIRSFFNMLAQQAGRI
jgi:hypothetical protein